MYHGGPETSLAWQRESSDGGRQFADAQLSRPPQAPRDRSPLAASRGPPPDPAELAGDHDRALDLLLAAVERRRAGPRGGPCPAMAALRVALHPALSARVKAGRGGGWQQLSRQHLRARGGRCCCGGCGRGGATFDALTTCTHGDITDGTWPKVRRAAHVSHGTAPEVGRRVRRRAHSATTRPIRITGRTSHSTRSQPSS